MKGREEGTTEGADDELLFFSCASAETFEFPADELVIKFHANGDVEDVGFFIAVKQIKC